MKNLITILLLTVSFGVFSQADTLTGPNGYKYECVNDFMLIEIEEDTISNAYLMYGENRLAWSTNKSVQKPVWEPISDSVIDLFDNSFESIITATGIQSYTDSTGISDLKMVTIKYDTLSIIRVDAEYSKNEKAPNGVLLNNAVRSKKVLTEAQMDPFRQLLLSDQVRALYLEMYDDNLGN